MSWCQSTENPTFGHIGKNLGDDDDDEGEGGLGNNLFGDLDAVVEAFPGGGADGGKLALVFGNEADGLSKSELERCDAICSIPMGRLVESLSVTHAGVIALSRYYERRSASGLATRQRG